MNQELENQLKQDAKTIQAQAAARLADPAFSAQLVTLLSEQPHSRHRLKQRSWLFGMAAVISLTVLVWMGLQTPESTPVAPSFVVSRTLDFNLKQVPQSVEAKINQPLVQEQQAIMADLKALKEQLLSI